MKTIEALLHDHLKYYLPRQTPKKEKIKMRQREEKINCNKDRKITLTFSIRDIMFDNICVYGFGFLFKPLDRHINKN